MTDCKKRHVPPQPEPVYGISESDIEFFENFASMSLSHPYNKCVWGQRIMEIKTRVIIQEDHDAAIRAEERENVLKEVSDYWEVGDCVYQTDHPHHQNSVLCHKQGHCIICFMKYRIESLRNSKQEEQE